MTLFSPKSYWPELSDVPESILMFSFVAKWRTFLLQQIAWLFNNNAHLVFSTMGKTAWSFSETEPSFHPLPPKKFSWSLNCKFAVVKMSMRHLQWTLFSGLYFSYENEQCSASWTQCPCRNNPARPLDLICWVHLYMYHSSNVADTGQVWGPMKNFVQQW